MQKVIVRPEGDPASPIALVGEAPGEEEEKHGVPFYHLAAAGGLLNLQLEIAGIPRHMCYVTNVVKERPPNGSIDSFIYKGRGDKIVTTAEYHKYEEALRIELKMIKANVVVALGNPALYALTRHWGIGKWRGSILHSPFINKKIIPTFHPAASLRGQYIWRHLIARDLRLAKAESTTPEVILPKRNIIVEPTYDETLRYLAHLPRMIGFDVEVLRGELSCFSVAKAWNDVIVVPLTKSNRPYFTPEHEANIMRILSRILEDDKAKKVGQNLLFDSSFMYMKYGVRMTNMDDTMVAHRILYPDFPFGLDFITTEYTRQPYYKADGKMHMKYGMSEDKFWIYSGLDSAVALEAFPKIMERLKDNKVTYYRQVATVEPLLFMYARGVKVDVEGMANKAAGCDKRLETLNARLTRQVGHLLNANSSKQMKEYFQEEKGLKPYTKWVKKDGRRVQTVTYDETAMIRIARRGYPEAQTILDIRGLVKLKGTYLDFKMDDDKRLRSSVNPVGTKNGRFSSSKTIFGTGMNLQNQPPEVKEFLIADDGYVAYEPDLATAETRIVAAIGPVPSLLEAFAKGEDVHSLTAGLMFGKDPRDVSDEDGSSSLGTGRFSERFWGKKTNHELAYDLGYRKFALQYQMSEKEAKELINAWHRIYPEVRSSYHMWVKEELRATKRLTNLFGRTRIFLGEWGGDLFRDGYAFTPQSTVPDMINERGILKIHHDQKRFRHVELLNQVHDSMWMQIPLSVGWEYHAAALLELKASLEQVLVWKAIEFTIPVDIKMGLNYKDMEKVRYSGEGIDNLAEALQVRYEEIAA